MNRVAILLIWMCVGCAGLSEAQKTMLIRRVYDLGEVACADKNLNQQIEIRAEVASLASDIEVHLK